MINRQNITIRRGISDAASKDLDSYRLQPLDYRAGCVHYRSEYDGKYEKLDDADREYRVPDRAGDYRRNMDETEKGRNRPKIKTGAADE